MTHVVKDKEGAELLAGDHIGVTEKQEALLDALSWERDQPIKAPICRCQAHDLIQALMKLPKQRFADF